MSQRFRELRERGNYSQEGIAAVAGVSQATWSAWERQLPSQFEAIASLTRYYDVSADYLLGLSNDPTPADRRRMWNGIVVAIANDLMELSYHRQQEIAREVADAVKLRRAEEHIKTLHQLMERLIGSERTDLIWQWLGTGDGDAAALLRLLDAPLDDERKHNFDAADKL